MDYNTLSVEDGLTHHEYEDAYRHWSPDSQPYAPADVLINYLEHGWNLKSIAGVETFYYMGHRTSEVYYFTLVREDKQIEMPVQSTPMLMRIIQENHLTVLRINVAREDERI